MSRAPRGVQLRGWSIERWRARPPTVDEARPSRCPTCQAASRPVGERLGLHGHGLRERQSWGVLDDDSEPAIHDLLVRRFRCRRCRATLTVRPEAMARRYLYLVTTIASALWRWSRRREPAHRVRRQLSPLRVQGAARPDRWRSLERWTRHRDRIWRGPHHSDDKATIRAQAADLCSSLAAFADRPYSVADDGEAAACMGAIARLAM